MACLAALLLSACSSAPKPPPPTRLDIQLSASATVNPDAHNRASPVMVRVYELKTPAAFESSDFFTLFDKDREALASDMTARDEFVLKPGDKVSLKREAKADTRFVAVLVAYRDLERSLWRATSPVALNKDQTFTVVADQRAVTIKSTTK